MADHSLKVIVGAKIDEFRTGMNAVAKELRAAEKAFKGFEVVGQRLQNMGKAFTTGFTLPIVAGFTAAGREFMGFEESMAKVQGLAGVSADAVAEFKDEILKLGPAVGKGPQELADALYFITSAGIKGAEAMEVLEMSAKASAVGLGQTKVVADLVTSAMNAYGAENLSAAKATDILVAAVREGKAEAPALAASMGQVLPIASEMGVSFDQVAASIGAMTRTGTSAETAAMELKNILVALVKPTTQANDALQAMGMSASGLREQIREEGLLAALMEIRERTNQFGEDAMAKVFPNIRALIGVLDMMGANVEDNAEIFKALTDTAGDLSDAFAITEETARHKLNVAMATLKATLLSVGDTVMTSVAPSIEWLTEKLKALAAWWMGLSDETRQFIVQAALVVAAIGPVLIILGTLLKSVKLIVDAVVLLKAGLGLLVGAFGPVGLAIAALIAAGVLLYKNWDEIRAAASRIWDAIIGVVGSAVKTVKGVIDSVIGAIQRAIDFIQNLLGISKSARSEAEANAAAAQAAASKAAQAQYAKAGTLPGDIAPTTTPAPAPVVTPTPAPSAAPAALPKKVVEAAEAMTAAERIRFYGSDILALPGGPEAYQHGGIVPGPIGAPRLAMVHGGETVLPTHQAGFGLAGSPVINVTITGPIYGMLDFEDKVKSVVRDAQRSGAFRGVIPAVS